MTDIAPAGPPKRLSRFIAIAELGAGHRVRIEGRAELVTKVERSVDGYHWCVSVHGRETYFVFPPGARFTRITG